MRKQKERAPDFSEAQLFLVLNQPFNKAPSKPKRSSNNEHYEIEKRLHSPSFLSSKRPCTCRTAATWRPSALAPARDACAAVGAEFERLPRPVKRHLTHVAPYAVLVFVVGVYHMARGVDEVGDNRSDWTMHLAHGFENHDCYGQVEVRVRMRCMPQHPRHLAALFASRCHRSTSAPHLGQNRHDGETRYSRLSCLPQHEQ